MAVKRLGVALIMLVLLTLAACGGYEGSLSRIDRPTIAITSYEGVESADSLASDLTTAQLTMFFQQNIYWNTISSHSSIKGVAYRVGRVSLDNQGNEVITYIQTPGHDVIDADGWVYHYNEGADESIPLSATAQRSIWAKETYTTINFPYNQVMESDTTNVLVGVSPYIGSVFEIKCMDARGQESETLRKYFQVKTCQHGVTVQTSKGAFTNYIKEDGTYETASNLTQTGKGFSLSFTMMGDVPYIDKEPWYFMYRVSHLSSYSATTGPVVSEVGEWKTTYNESDISKATIYTNDIANVDEGHKLLDLEEYNMVEAKVVDYSGVESPITTQVFYVSGSFHPAALIYDDYSYAVGSAQYMTYQPGTSSSETRPTLYSGSLVATPLYLDSRGLYNAVYTSDLHMYMRWGYYGEYGDADGNPVGGHKYVVRDVATGKNYYSEICYYDIRLNGDFYYYPPIVTTDPTAVFTDPETGERWLRVSSTSDIAQSIILTPAGNYMRHSSYNDLDGARNLLEIRVVDLQGVTSATSSFEYYLFDPVLSVNKHGVLVIDDSPNGNQVPDATLDARWNTALTGFSASSFDYDTVHNANKARSFYDSSVISPSELDQYKTVLFICDDPGTDHLGNEAPVLEQYLSRGGNLVFAGGPFINADMSVMSTQYSYLYTALGLRTDKKTPVNTFNQSWVTKPYLWGGTGENGFPSSLVDMTSTAVNHFLSDRQGMGQISFVTDENQLQSSRTVTILQRANCKPVNWQVYPPSQENYNEINGKIVAWKANTNTYSETGNTCYVFTYPLGFLEQDDLTTLMQTVINETGY